jgi:hypothetical protein
VWTPTDSDQPTRTLEPVTIQGGHERGLILHKLLEEVLTGETADTVDALTEHEPLLAGALGKPVFNDPDKGLSPAEFAECLTRTLDHPEIVRLQPTLVPEFPVYASQLSASVEMVTTRVIDATSFGEDGKPQVVIDWKRDVQPSPIPLSITAHNSGTI